MYHSIKAARIQFHITQKRCTVVQYLLLVWHVVNAQLNESFADKSAISTAKNHLELVIL